MSGDEDWWVLPETPDGDGLALSTPIHAPEGREQAVRLAEDFCRNRGVYQHPGTRAARQVYRLSPTAWLVAYQRPRREGSEIRYHKGHFRVTIATLEASVEAEIPEEKKKGLFRRG
ncbi:MAG TPA: hypothetical protein VGF17_24075 [Phytomonospora sp.]